VDAGVVCDFVGSWAAALSGERKGHLPREGWGKGRRYKDKEGAGLKQYTGAEHAGEEGKNKDRIRVVGVGRSVL
jgi:hypothetical protein